MRLNKELTDEEGRYRLDKNQIGFRYGLGCEVNIMRLMESLRSMKKQNEHGT